MKAAGIPELALLLLCFALTLMVFFLFSLSPSISTDQSFIGSTFQLIMKAKSSPVFVFFFCNLIVIAILIENSTSSYQEFDWFGFLSSEEEENEIEEVNIMGDMEENNQNNDDYDDDDDEEEDEAFHGYDGYDEDNDDDSEDDDLDSEVEEGDDDLEKRIEEFIAKINEAWKAERLMERRRLQ